MLPRAAGEINKSPRFPFVFSARRPPCLVKRRDAAVRPGEPAWSGGIIRTEGSAMRNATSTLAVAVMVVVWGPGLAKADEPSTVEKAMGKTIITCIRPSTLLAEKGYEPK